MNVSNDQHLWVSWDEYNRAIEKLALTVHESGWKFDQILCLARGGLRLAREGVRNPRRALSWHEEF